MKRTSPTSFCRSAGRIICTTRALRVLPEEPREHFPEHFQKFSISALVPGRMQTCFYWAYRAGESEPRSTSGPTSAPMRAPTRGHTRVDFPVFSPSRTPTKAPTKRPTKASTEVPTKVSSQVVEVHLSCFQPVLIIGHSRLLIN